MMNTVNTAVSTAKNSTGKYVPLKMVAEKAGVSVPTASRAIRMKTPVMGDHCAAERVRKIASEMGYVSRQSPEWKAARKAKKEQERMAAYLRTHNFPSKEAETARMLALREQGYSNAEIGRKIGVDKVTVRRRIGAQSPDMTIENRLLAQKHRAQRNQERKIYTAKHAISAYNNAAETLTRLEKEYAAAQESVRNLKPAADKAQAFLNTVGSSNPASSLAALEPTLLQ